MEAEAATQETTINDATTHQIQSTTGVETSEGKTPSDSDLHKHSHTCIDIEVRRINIPSWIAHIEYPTSATESDMESVDISSDDESDDGWSVISDDSDFVVVNPAETTHRSSNARSRRRLGLPRRGSKLQASSSTSEGRQQNKMTCEKDGGELRVNPAVDHSRGKDAKDSQQCAGPKDTGNVIDALIECLTEQARALKL